MLTPDDLAESVGALIFEATGRGVSIHPSGEQAIVTGYVQTEAAAHRASHKLERTLGVLAAETGSTLPVPQPEPLPEEDWLTAWQRYYHPLRVGRRLVIKPRWEKWPPDNGQVPAHDDDIIIELDPQMAFGTGTHPTTQLCLEALESIVEPGHIVADIGCGSGILSIAAAKLGAREVLAVDNDPVAAQTAMQNCRYNNVQEMVRVINSDGLVAVSESFDVIVANINGPTIASLAGEFASHLITGGHLVASGIIAAEAPNQQAVLATVGLSVCRVETRQDWICLIAQ